MDIRQLEYFLELVRQSSVSAAANMLNISQPAVSKSLRSLEREIGTPLFDRLGNRLRLNKNGQEFYTYAQRSVQSLHSGLNALQQNRYDILGELTLVSLTFLPILSDCLMEYQRLNPKIKIVTQQSGVAAGEDISWADLVLRAAPDVEDLPRDDHWESAALFGESYRLVAADALLQPLPEQDALDPAALQHLDFVTIRSREPFFIDLTVDICRRAGFAPRVRYLTNDFLTKVQLMGEGRAVGILPECCMPLARRLYPGLHSYGIQGQTRERKIFLLRRRDSLSPEIARDFYAFAADWFSPGREQP